jgi:hypothetical protein
MRLREAININKGLLALAKVISALVDNQGHVPYRWGRRGLGDVASDKITGMLGPWPEQCVAACSVAGRPPSSVPGRRPWASTLWKAPASLLFR